MELIETAYQWFMGAGQRIKKFEIKYWKRKSHENNV